MCAHTYTHECMYIYICMYVCIFSYLCMHMYVYIYIYHVCVCMEKMVDVGESDKMIKISGKGDKVFSLNKEGNITTKLIVSVLFIHFSSYF